MGWSDSDDRPGYYSYIPRIPRSAEAKFKGAVDDVRRLSTTQTICVGMACTTSFLLGWRLAKAGASWRRFTAVSDIPSSQVGAGAPWLRGRVVSVTDGDTLRIYHTPSLLHSSRMDESQKLSDSTLQIRVCTIDTPETSKFGRPSQPFGEEAKEHLSSLVNDRMVKVRVLATDQYGRGVGEVLAPGPLFGFPRKYADTEMLKAGLAEVYQGGGAVYGQNGKEAYLAMEEKARKKKKGIWSLRNRETAAEFKARAKAEG